MSSVDNATSTDVSNTDNVNQAEVFKDKANALFAAKKFDEAIENYSEAIKLNPTIATYYTNRSFAYSKIEAYGYAIQDAEKSIELDNSFAKGYYRRGIAHMAMAKFKDSLKDFRIVVKLRPNDADARSKLSECEKIVRRIEFEKAIQSDKEKKCVADTINLDAIIVEPSYDGCLIEGENITSEFVDDMVKRFKEQKKIHKKMAYTILLAAKKMYMQTPTLVDIDIPEGSRLTVCGDTHGQYYDLLNIFEKNGGPPSPTNVYLFNGDFVDRGSFSVEIIFTLLAYKLLYPTGVYLNRGNHETDNMNKVYGFEGEVKAKFSEVLFNLFSETFDALPLAHLIKNKILVVHGGLFSRDDVTLDEIRKINRFCQPPSEGLMCELLWSDPQPQNGRSPSKRGIGIQFGPDVTHNFLQKNGLDLLIRSHEVKDAGYQIEHGGKCVTVFSAPNYCDSVGNDGAFINISPEMELKYTQFKAVPHPNVRPMQYANQFGSGLI